MSKSIVPALAIGGVTGLVLLAMGIFWWDIRHQPKPIVKVTQEVQLVEGQWYWYTFDKGRESIYDSNYNVIATWP